jgi:HD domain
VERTGGRLTAAERRELARPLAVSHAGNIVGRVAMLLRVNSGRRRDPSLGRRAVPDSPLTRAAMTVAQARLSPALLNHSHRTFLFGAALGELEGLDVDREVLYAAALLHDVGLPTDVPLVDFTRASARAAQQVAEQVGLSTAATDTLRSAITLHYSPGVSLTHGPVAYLLSAGAAVDVVGLRSWQLPPALLTDVVTAHPRRGFKREFTAAFRAEAVQVPQGRAAYLRCYAALDLAIRTAPFHG